MNWLDYPITHGFIPSYDPNIGDTPHYADDLGTPFHTPITALKSGTVLQADYAAWGGEIFIQPDDRSTEYYVYHLDQNQVIPGQHVNAGDIIGISGGENPGYPGALHPADPAWSTGPHTHVGYFTNWISTPIGTRPEGPDITPLLTAIKTGQTSLGLAGGGSGLAGGGSGLAGGGSGLPNVAAGLQSVLIRTGLFFIILILLMGGIYILFKDQINSGVKTGVEIAGKAALV